MKKNLKKKNVCTYVYVYIYIYTYTYTWDFLGWASGKESACQRMSYKRGRFDPWVGEIPWRRAWQPTLVFLLGESHRQRSLEGPSP